MNEKKFNPKQIHKLNHPDRYQFQSPDLIWETLDVKDPKILVDIGAGTGFFAMPFSDRIKEGTVYACDTSDVMIDWMHENIPHAYHGRVIPLKTGEISIPLEDDCADLVYMINLHHELDNPQGMMVESARLLKKNGLLAVIDWKASETPSGPPLEIRIPEECIRGHFEHAGLINIRSYHLLPFHSFTVGEK